MEAVKRASVKQFLRQNKMRTSAEVYSVVDAQVEAMLKKACYRAKANGRQTVMGQDI